METTKKTIFSKIILPALVNLILTTGFAQDIQFKILPIALPKAIQNPDHEFSGLCLDGEKLYLLPENRLSKNEVAKLYVIKLSDIEHQLKDSLFELPFDSVRIDLMNKVKQKIKADVNVYEGLEAILIDGSTVYLSVETTTASIDCYLLTGTLNNESLVIENQLKIKKSVRDDGTQIYNAGFESLMTKDNELVAFFEYNNFSIKNYARILDREFRNNEQQFVPFVQNLPFRLTDITRSGINHFTGLNYFYKGGGADTLYRPSSDDSLNNKLVKSKSGYHNYCRLIDIELKGNSIVWKPLYELPAQYWGYNWEGIAAYKKGYFIINDRYTPHKPYGSVLLYLKK